MVDNNSIVLITDNDEIAKSVLEKLVLLRNNDNIILLILNQINPELILKAYDSGIYDYLLITADNYDYMIKAVNSFKYCMQKDENRRNQKFLNQIGVIDTKTELYHQKYLKEVFIL